VQWLYVHYVYLFILACVFCRDTFTLGVVPATRRSAAITVTAIVIIAAASIVASAVIASAVIAVIHLLSWFICALFAALSRLLICLSFHCFISCCHVFVVAVSCLS